MDAKGIVWRIIRFCGNCCYKFLRKYPLFSGVVILVFLLYMFFPVVFYFLMYSSPVVVCTGVYLKTRYPDTKKQASAALIINRSALRHQKSVRRKPRMQFIECGNEDCGNILFKTSLVTKTNFLDGTGNDCALGDGEFVPDTRPPSVWDDIDRFARKDGGGGGKEMEQEKDDDEKNLMDSELERNQRLESLMAKRRARKLFRIAVEKTLMNKNITCISQIAPLLLAKTNSIEEEILQMPGSAPSVLLPTQNPFDLPYDSHEEKPNLMTDSFQQEFRPGNQTVKLVSRHHNEEMWESSEVNGAKQREFDDIVEQEVMQNLSSLFSSENVVKNSVSSETHKDVKQINEKVEGIKTCDKLSTDEDPGNTMEKSLTLSPSESFFQKPQHPEKLIQHWTGIDPPSKSEKGSANSDVPEATVRQKAKKDTKRLLSKRNSHRSFFAGVHKNLKYILHPQAQSKQEQKEAEAAAAANAQLNVTEHEKKNDKLITGKGKSQSSVRKQAQSEKANKHEADESDNTSTPETAK